jgi:hypothetical protein
VVPCPWGAATGGAAPLGFMGHLSRLGLYPCPWGAAAAIGEPTPLGFKGQISRLHDKFGLGPVYPCLVDAVLSKAPSRRLDSGPRSLSSLYPIQQFIHNV